MKKYIFALLLAMLMGVGFALELPDDSTIVVTNEAGTVVGFGEYDDGVLELEISEDATGLLTLTFTDESGNEVTVEIEAMEDGTIVVTDGEGTELGEAVGGITEVSRVSGEEIEEELAERESEEDGAESEKRHGLDVADEAAGENGQHGRDRARAAQESRGGSDDGESDEPVEVEEEEIEEEESEEVESEDGEETEEKDGLDIADEAAGENGQHGRDVARNARDTRGGTVDDESDVEEVEEVEEEEVEETEEVE